MNPLFDKLKSSGNLKAEPLNKSSFFNDRDTIPTEIPIINLAFSGNLDGGLTTGLTMFAGEPATFKTLLGLYTLKAYFDKYPESICLFYDSEFGITNDYLEGFGIDSSRILHIPILNLEELKFDISQRLEAINKGDKVFIFVDSVGNTASVKEAQDAVEAKSVQDMSRPKQLKSLFRIITPHLAVKDIPCVVINHTYKSQGMYPIDVVAGGQGGVYSSNQIFVISKSQEKDGKELEGFQFTINIFKSRYVKQKSKFPFKVMFDQGIMKWSGLIDIALEGNFLAKPKKGWIQEMDPETGEFVSEQLWREKELETSDEFWGKMLQNQKFKDFVSKKYKLGNFMFAHDDINYEVDDENDD